MGTSAPCVNRRPLCVVVVGAALMVATMLVLAAPVAAQETEPAVELTAEQRALNEQLRAGASAYSQNCASCHQAGGIGLESIYPPLIGNENLADEGYVESVIITGRAGQITVAGVEYDGVMPSFSALSDEDTDAVVAFIANDLVAPPLAVTTDSSDGVPGFFNVVKWVAYAAFALTAVVFAPRISGVTDRLKVPWLDAWLKAGAIVVSVTVLVVIIPDRVVRWGRVARLDRFYQDLIGVSAWLAGLGIVLGTLWYAQRESRV